jgi:TolB-like protein/Tfp pilus assembly protein PilF
MPQHPTRKARFWKELKRRRVIHVTTVYASASFVLIELVNNLSEPLNLPPNLATIVIIVLAVGFPLAVILSWIYDLTGEGFQKTRPIDEVQEAQVAKVPNAWKIATYASFVVIIGLVVLNLAARDKLVKPGAIQSLVILPFDNFTGDESLEYFVSGMHASLIGDMGRIGGMRVISKTSSNLYRGVDMSVPQIASELGVDAVVEPTVMCLGDSICLQIKVFSAYPEEKLIWVADYKEEKSQILNLYNRITKQIAGEARIELTAGEEELLAKDRTVDPDALDAFLKGQFYWEKLDAASVQIALEYFEEAIEKDPEWADPYAGLAQAWSLAGRFGIIPASQAKQKKYQFINKALELDPNSAHAHYVKANDAVWTEWDWVLGEKEFQKTLDLNPNHELARLYYAHLLMILRRTDEAVYQAKIGLELDPLRPLVLGLYGVVMTHKGDYQAAISAFEKAKSIAPDFRFAFNVLPALYWNGDYEDWIKTWEEKVLWNSEAKASVVNTFYERGHIAAVEEMFNMNEKYGNGIGNANMTYSLKAYRYMYLNKPEEALNCLEKMYEQKDLNATYMATNLYYYDELKNYPRYIALLEKMNLPLPEAH